MTEKYLRNKPKGQGRWIKNKEKIRKRSTFMMMTSDLILYVPTEYDQMKPMKSLLCFAIRGGKYKSSFRNSAFKKIFFIKFDRQLNKSG